MWRSAALPLLLLPGCGDGALCSTDVVRVVRAPGSDRYAVIAVRDCGATTDFATVIRVGRASEPQRDTEEIFVADSNHGNATAREGNAIGLHLVWTGPSSLTVTYAAGARVFKANGTAGPVTIRYLGERIFKR